MRIVKKSLALLLALTLIVSTAPLTFAADYVGNPNDLPVDYIDNSNDGLRELLETSAPVLETPISSRSARLMGVESAADKKADLVFVIDSTGSMADEISNVKMNITTFAQSLETQGIKLRIGIVEYRDTTVDGLNSTIVHKLNYSTWLNNTAKMVDALGTIRVGGGGDIPETIIDGLGYLVDDETMLWSSDSYKFAVVLTDANYKVDNRHGYSNLQEISDALAAKQINTSIITSTSHYNTYNALADATGGILANITSNFDSVLSDG